MLLDSQIDALSVQVTSLYVQYEQSVIKDIARRIARMDMTSTAAWQMQRLVESGKLYDHALEEIAKLTGKSEESIRDAFNKAGIESMRFDDAIYRAAGLNPLPLNLSPAMQQVLVAGLEKTKGSIRNLTMSAALSAENAFTQAADLAYMQVVNGAMSYSQAIKLAIKDMAAKGIPTVNYATGHVDQIDVAVRRALLTGVTQTTGQLQMKRADEMGQDLVAVSAHIGSRKSHSLWQGKIYSRSGKSPKYPDFITSTGYGTGAGLGGWNCRHSFYPFFEGISENAYSQATVDQFNNDTVIYNGQRLPTYKALEQQREWERGIRKYKRQAGALEAAGISSSEELQKISILQATLRDFTKQTGLKRDYFREGGVWSKGIGTIPLPKPFIPTPPPVVPPVLRQDIW